MKMPTYAKPPTTDLNQVQAFWNRRTPRHSQKSHASNSGGFRADIPWSNFSQSTGATQKKKKKRLPREKLVECTSTMSGLQTTAQLPSNAHGWRGTWARVRWSGSDRPERWSRYLTCQSQRTWPDCLTWPLSLRDYPSEICLRDYPDKFSHRILK